MECQDRGSTLRTHLAYHTPWDALRRPGCAGSDLRQRPCTVACKIGHIHRVLRSAWPTCTKERRDMHPQPTSRRLFAHIGTVLPPRQIAALAQRLKLSARTAKRRTHESNTRLWRCRARPRDERQTSVCSSTPKPHQQRLEHVICMVCKEHCRCTRLCSTMLERSKAQPSCACCKTASVLCGVHVDNLKRNAKLRAQTCTVIGIRIGICPTEMVMDMHCTRQCRSVSTTAPSPCAEQERSRVHTATEGDEHPVPPTDPATLPQGCTCTQGRACTPNMATQSTIGGVHTLMLRRFALDSADA